MGYKCPKCNTDNGITHYIGKTCKKCGYVLILSFNDKGDKNER